jgi:hypothetical protein
MKKAILAALVLASLVLAAPYAVGGTEGVAKAASKGPVAWIAAALCGSC